MAISKKLTPRQARFVEEYLLDLNATRAAIRAGYSAKTAGVQGPRMLGNVRVAEVIHGGKKARSARLAVAAERVLQETAALAFSSHAHYYVDAEGRLLLAPGAPPDAHAAISSIKYRTTTNAHGRVTREIEIRLWDKLGPLKLAGRHVGLFPERVEHTGEDGGPIKTRQEARDEAIEALRALRPDRRSSGITRGEVTVTPQADLTKEC